MLNPAFSREERGKAIAAIEGAVKRIDATTYLVFSQSGHGAYDVMQAEIGWLCSCPDHLYRGSICKHIHAVQYSFALRNAVSSTRIESITDPSKCLYCGSTQIVRDGIRRNKRGDIQIFNCKACGHYFTLNLGFEGMRATPQAITGAMQLYFSGESLRNVQKFLKLQGVSVSHVAVYKWIRKYVRLMETYLESIKPQVSDTWRADEMYLKIKGDPKYLYALMDDQTRFWIAQKVGGDKWHVLETTQTAKTLFTQGEESIGRRPRLLITDGLPAYRVACRKLWWTQRRATRTKHISHIQFKGDFNNNKMERMNGEIRDREKVLRGLKKSDSPVLRGYQLYHNYFRTHEGLNGKTPAEAAGIQIQGENKWMTVIQNSVHSHLET